MKRSAAITAFFAAAFAVGLAKAAPVDPAVRIVASAAPGVTTLSLPGEPTVQLDQNDLGIFVDDARRGPDISRSTWTRLRVRSSRPAPWSTSTIL
jgi:hypothetical protein